MISFLTFSLSRVTNLLETTVYVVNGTPVTAVSGHARLRERSIFISFRIHPEFELIVLNTLRVILIIMFHSNWMF